MIALRIQQANSTIEQRLPVGINDVVFVMNGPADINDVSEHVHHTIQGS